MEELKRILSERFEREYEEYSAMLEIKRSEMARLETEMKKKKLEEEGKRLRQVILLSRLIELTLCICRLVSVMQK